MKLQASWIRWIVDFAMLWAAYGAAYLLRYESGLFHVNIKGDFLAASVLLSLSWSFVFAAVGHYSGTLAVSWLDHAKRVAIVVLIGGLTLFWLTFEAEHPLPPGRFVLIAYGVGIVLLVASGRFLLFFVQRSIWSGGQSLARTAIIGHGRWAELLKDEFTQQKEYGHELIGFIRLPNDNAALPGVELGKLHDLIEVIRANKLQAVILAWEHEHVEEVLQSIMTCTHERVQVYVVPELRDHAAAWSHLQVRDDLPLYIVKSEFHPNWERMLKRAAGGANA